MKDIKVGMMVRHKSGGPKMYVWRITGNTGKLVECEWFSAPTLTQPATVCRNTFLPDALEEDHAQG